ncbi:DUF488 family protein [Nitrobacter sp. TKz-YC02]|uniref:DUF488 domain-containing protein n=1 Tax=Nitrobacter sp. TKz-YC02 TaxID=3398704 RepID=UPI003CEFE435
MQLKLQTAPGRIATSNSSISTTSPDRDGEDATSRMRADAAPLVRQQRRRRRRGTFLSGARLASVTNPVYTVGHSTRTIDEFAELLIAAEICTLVDVRSLPSSRRFPHFNREPLSDALESLQIGYVYCAALGGHRGKSKMIAQEINAFWENQSFHNYADYAMSEAFLAGLERIIATSQHELTAIMCAEAVWWRCHRRIIADYLISRQIPVRHILGPGKIVEAQMTLSAERRGAVISYPA